MRRVSALVAALVSAAALLQAPHPAAAQQQQIEIKAPPPEKRVPLPEILPPPGAREITRPRESEFYPDNIRVRLDPAFVEPLTAVKQTNPKSAIQFGLAGWTAPNTPVPQGGGTFREVSGWFALGFAIVWDVPVGRGAGAPPAASPR